MCLCVKYSCPVIINLGVRARDEIADLICFTILRRRSSKESKTPIDKEESSKMSNNNESPTIISHPIPAPRKPRPVIPIISYDDDKPLENIQKWNDSLRNRIENVRKNMSERPLPIPVENEFFYMEVSRQEAVQLLEGHADGTFILRPSTQALHAYTITLTYQGRIYNIGCRRRPDGRFALGFKKPNEQSFITINELIEHHYQEKLVLLVDGVQFGSTVLRKLTD